MDIKEYIEYLKNEMYEITKVPREYLNKQYKECEYLTLIKR